MDKQKVNYAITFVLFLLLNFVLFSQTSEDNKRKTQSFRFAIGSFYEGQAKTFGISPGLEYHVSFPTKFIIGGSVFGDLSFITTKHLPDEIYQYPEFNPTKKNRIITYHTRALGAQIHPGFYAMQQEHWRIAVLFPMGIYYQVHYNNTQWDELGVEMNNEGKSDKLAFIFISGLKLDTEYKVNKNVFGLSLMAEPDFALTNIFSNWAYPVFRAQFYYQILF